MKEPLIVTYDNDVNGKKIIIDLKREYKNDYKIYFFPIPFNNIIEYENGTIGGSFEEMFDYNFFLKTCFSNEFLTEN